MLAPCYSDLVPETGERLCCYDDVVDATPRQPLATVSIDEAADRLIIGDAAGVLWELNGGAKSAFESHEHIKDAPLTRLETAFRLPGSGAEPARAGATGGRPWAVARCVRGTRTGDVLLVGASRRDVCVASVKNVSNLSNKNTFLGGASVRVVCRHERRITCVSEASTVAVATGDVSGDVRVAALSCDALGADLDAADPLNVEARARREETMASADHLLDQGCATAPRAHGGQVTAVHLVRDPLDARVVISCGTDCKVRVWAFGQQEVFTLTLARELRTGEHTPTSLAPLKRSEMLLAVGHQEGLVSVWAVDGDEPELRSICDDGGRRVVKLEASQATLVATDDKGAVSTFTLERGTLVPRGLKRGPAPYLALSGLSDEGGPTAIQADGLIAQPFAPPQPPPEEVFERLAPPATPPREAPAAPKSPRPRDARDERLSRPVGRSRSSSRAARSRSASPRPHQFSAAPAAEVPADTRSPRRYASPPRSPSPPALFEAEAPAPPRRPSLRRAADAARDERRAARGPPRGRAAPRRASASPRRSLSPEAAPRGRAPTPAAAPVRRRRRAPSPPPPPGPPPRREAASAFAKAPPPGGDRTLDDLRVEEAVRTAKDCATQHAHAEAEVKARARDYVASKESRQRAYAHPENLVPLGLDAKPRLRVVPKQVDGKWLARLDALRPREADFPLPDDGADALAARVPAPAAPRPRAILARLDDALGDEAYAFPALAF